MQALTIKTNNRPRHTAPGYILFDNESIRAQFDYLSDEEFRDESFVLYRGRWYAMCDFLVTPDSLKEWDGYHGDSAYSGVLIKAVDNSTDEVIMGTFYS